MTFAGLKVGDHFIWLPVTNTRPPDELSVNIKIAEGEDGGGFAIDLATRLDCISPLGPDPNAQLAEWIPPSTPVIKLSGRM